MRAIQGNSSSILLSVLLVFGCVSAGPAVTPSGPAPVPDSASSDTVGPDTCFGVRNGTVVLVLERKDDAIRVASVDRSSDELMSVGRCLSAYVVGHPPKSDRVAFVHRAGRPPELLDPAPDASAAKLWSSP